jgi:hypothetical protein
MGLFAHLLGIRPWEWDQLDYEQALSLKHFVDEMNKPASGQG